MKIGIVEDETVWRNKIQTILGGALGENAKQVYLSGKSAEIVVKWFIFNTAQIKYIQKDSVQFILIVIFCQEALLQMQSM